MGINGKEKIFPFWVFKSASGYAVIRLYEGLQEMIEIRRVDNPEYADILSGYIENVGKF